MLQDSLNADDHFFDKVVISSPLIVSPELSVNEAIGQMYQARSSYALVVEQRRPVGIFTERDLVRMVAADQPAGDLTISAVMTASPATIAASEVKTTADLFAQMQQAQVRHLIVVDEDGRLVGIITRRSLRQALTTPALLKFKSVAEVMTPETICLDQNAPVIQAARLMAERDISCVVITAAENDPAGIITERDIVQFKALDLGIHNTLAQQVMSSPLLPARSQDSLWSVHQQMNRHRVRRLVVCNAEGQLAGIITQSSILQSLNSAEARQVIDLLQQEVTQLRFENQALLEARNQELERSQTRLSGQLEDKQIEQQQTQSDLAAAYHELEISHDELVKTNEALTVALQDLQGAQQLIQLANTDLESQVERRSADLHQAERRWRSLLEDVHLVVIGLDCDGKVNYVNPFFLGLTGYSADEVIGKQWFGTFILQEDYHPTRHYFQQLIAHGEVPLRYRNDILTRAGTARTIDWNNAILRDRQNAVIGTMSIGEDITERLEVDRIKGEFISVISHELRTPLTAINGSLELLTGSLVSSESDRGKQLLQLAADSAQRLVRLVNDILELERLESGKVLLQKDKLDTRSLTDKAVDTFQVVTRERGITLNVSDPGLSIMADGDRLIQVLTNLLDNAINFSEDNSTIWLSVEPKDGDANDTAAKALFKVRDQGQGIHSEQLSEIFERFTQVNRSHSREKGGTGLGLAICQNIVEQHDGRIWVESKLSEGSCFQFTIPLNDGVAM